MKNKIILFFLLFIGETSYAGLNIDNYENCTGVPLESLKIKSYSNFSVLDSYKNYGYDYSAILDNSKKNLTECLIVNNSRKVILDIIPSIVNSSCSGQWDQTAKSPVWMSDIGGGKDGVEYFYYSPIDNLKRLKIEDDSEIVQVIESITCQMDTYSKIDVGELNDSAYYLYKLGRLNESLNILNKVIQLDPNRTVAYLNLADVYLLLNNKKLAKENYLIYVSKMKKSGLSNKIPNRVKKYL